MDGSRTGGNNSYATTGGSKLFFCYFYESCLVTWTWTLLVAFVIRSSFNKCSYTPADCIAKRCHQCVLTVDSTSFENLVAVRRQVKNRFKNAGQKINSCIVDNFCRWTILLSVDMNAYRLVGQWGNFLSAQFCIYLEYVSV